MPIAISAEQRAVQASIRQWAAKAGTLATVRGMERDPGTGWAGQWADLARLGVFSIALPEQAGGAGGSACDLAAALEQVTDALVPGPVLPTVLAGLVLAPHLDAPAVKSVLADLGSGAASVAVALGTGTITATPAADGALRVSGLVGPVLGAGAGSHLLLAAQAPGGVVWFLVEAGHPGVRLHERAPVDFSRALADVRLGDVIVPPECVVPVAVDLRDVAAMLGAAEASAVAGWCLRTAAEYAKVRHQFGRAIGAFQAVKHLCAGMLCRSERAAAVAWDAARAYDEAPGEFPLAAAAAATVALGAAVDNAKDCIPVLGGIGFTWEHDAHLYLRRALALRALLGGGPAWRERTATLVLAGSRRSLGAAATADGDRPAVRARAAEIAALADERQRRVALAEAGYLTPHWPAPYGLGASAGEQLLIDDELARAGVTRPELAIAGWAVPTILRHGTADQQQRFAGPSLRGDITWCQLFSEPGAGSDLASLRTRAERIDGGWRLTGQKVWTSLASQADWAICLARTDPAAPKHRGLTYFLVEMRSPGVEIRPLREITGRAVFSEVFLDAVFVPDECVVGDPGEGWRLARATLEHERVAMGGGSALGESVERLAETVRAGGLAEDAGVRDRLGGLVADGIAVSLLDLRSTLRRLAGEADESGAAESAVAKLVGVGHRQAVAEAALEFGGPDGAATDGASADPVHEFLLSRCLSIAGGTTQILLSVVAERVLGLPRDEVR
ncbi:MAG: 3-oxochol-4-en-24-oyl-CoA dehydrogenase [Cryptosporangiaceae bacterium]|nr:3-oxochol-4-en-24-oyl-CoA dehydrogenase [Cryptosporangiaceae bacterium]